MEMGVHVCLHMCNLLCVLHQTQRHMNTHLKVHIQYILCVSPDWSAHQDVMLFLGIYERVCVHVCVCDLASCPSF